MPAVCLCKINTRVSVPVEMKSMSTQSNCAAMKAEYTEGK